MNPEYANWEIQDQLLMNWLQASLTKSVFVQVIGCSTSKEAWQTPDRLYSSKSLVRIMQLHFELRTIKKGTLTMVEYLRKIKGIVDNLVVTGQPLSQVDYVLPILSGLGPEYESFVTSIITTCPDQVSSGDVQGMLFNHEIRLEHLKSSLDISPFSTNVATRNKQTVSDYQQNTSKSRGNRMYNNNNNNNSKNKTYHPC
ncbi:PREDICTED: uncharacterized protein LOC104605873 [Nelumbo nucifera]|uniref:Uncharacterized protein LOC104605873 n=1 Tax=Nelumbo nucifera TaxID=4432 RepID=A0A1U8ARX1_NELNU|nr:PREDICTED: uncharacterized protein LOC104605873 [Nelumbo nucifera]